MHPLRRYFFTAALALLWISSLVVAHEEVHSSAVEGETSGPSITHDSPDLNGVSTAANRSYFHHVPYSAFIYIHIALLTAAWTIVLPCAVMLSIGRSRISLPVQLVFHVLNALGIVASVTYNTKTPDLYPNNAHHPAGWAVSSILAVWTALGLIRLRGSSRSPMSEEALNANNKLHGDYADNLNRWSHDSGQGTERNTASLYTASRANSWPSSEQGGESESFLGYERPHSAKGRWLDRFLPPVIPRIKDNWVFAAFDVLYIVLERFAVVLSWFLLLTGVVTFTRVFEGRHVFGGIAHTVKGSIFVLWGTLSFGRWIGCFADIGWAWNIKPSAGNVGRLKFRIPTAEFTESFVIFLYGASNVFLEHLTGWGGVWTPMDIEHVSITLMFFGGGLLGMLIDSKDLQKSSVHTLNPLPLLVIGILGVGMSSHHQHSSVSSAIHSLWGHLFVGFAIMRAITYVTLYLKPATSTLPSRPPSEILSAFFLVSGGIVFILSNGDTVDSIEAFGANAMIVLLLAVGIATLFMAWTVFLITLKDWAAGRHYRRIQSGFSLT